MLSEFKSFQFMGVSNSQVFLSEKDLSDMEFNLLVRPVLEFHHDHEECQTLPLEAGQLSPKQKQKVQEHDQEEDKDDEEEQRRVSVPAPLKIKIPSYEDIGSEKDDQIQNGGFKTPTSAVHKISEILKCPPAPKKPKSVPSTKRKASRPQFLLDLSKEIESLFPMPIVVDLGGKIKKVKQGK